MTRWTHLPVATCFIGALTCSPGYAKIPHGGVPGDDQTSVVYNVTTGELGVDAPADKELTSILIHSDAGIFTGEPAWNLGGEFDIDTDHTIFKAVFDGGFSSLSFGNIAQVGLSPGSFITNDLTAVATISGEGLARVDCICLPEPSALILLLLGLGGLALWRWRRTARYAVLPKALVTIGVVCPSAVVPAQEPSVLQAGDADQDLDFDPFDLILSLQSGKYGTGQPATWGDGDWNGAPGGQPGNPPAGNGLFDQSDLNAAIANGLYVTGTYGSDGLTPPELLTPFVAPFYVINDGRTSVVYNPSTGEVAVDAAAGTEFTSIVITSQAGIFTGAPATNLGGAFDVDADHTIFKATFGGSFDSISFGNVAQQGLSAGFVHDDLRVAGSVVGGGDLGDVDCCYLPEPASVILMVLGLAGLSPRRTGPSRGAPGTAWPRTSCPTLQPGSCSSAVSWLTPS